MPALHCALINNMPDGAFVSSERQFLGLVRAGLDPTVTLEVQCHALPRPDRADHVARHIAAHYRPLDLLRSENPDVVIVTGAQPTMPDLDAEPYWDDLIAVLRWAVSSARTVLLSCLSAHAALLAFDGIRRGCLPAKCTGVFDQDVAAAHPLTAALVSPFAMPHSRINEVETRAVADAGYDVLVASAEAGWGVIARRLGSCLMLLVQGHPEYDATSLLREYRRDVERYASGCGGRPCLPERCVAASDWPALVDFHRRATTEAPDPALLRSFAFDDVARRAPWPWRQAATTLYTNWLAEVGQPSL